MGKRLTTGSAIEKQSPPQQLTLSQKRVALIGMYLYKFGAIEGRNRVIDEELIGIYAEALEEFEVSRVEKGMKRYLAEGQKFPWPGDLTQMIEEEV